MTSLIHWLQLIRTENIGPKRFWTLLKEHKTAEKALLTLKNPYPHQKAEQEYNNHLKSGFQLLTRDHPHFPKQLKKLSDCPPIISASGNLPLLNRPSLAIVGARNASLGGRKIAKDIATDLQQAGWSIVSGFARGIDSCAHAGALPNTIGVLANGIDVIYPAENEDLYNSLKEKGGLISEMPLGTPPTATLFPRRNRLVAGLAQALIIIEAAPHSGSLITAQYALDQGIELFVIPGSPLDPRNRGSNTLIRQGATLIESAKDILEIMGYPQPCSNNNEPLTFFTPFAKRSLSKSTLLGDLSQTPLSLDILLEQYGNPSLLLSLLTELECEGLIHRMEGDHFILKPPTQN